tara:strand:+ start:448 stop:1011 length:564 start_codon:yes stop_codon:yes gene_type:complete
MIFQKRNDMATKDLKVITGKVRFAFCKNVLTPDQKGIYSIMILIDKKDKETLAKINSTVEKFKTDPAAVASWGGKFMSSFKTPLRDGDTERDTEKSPEYKGHYFINANTYNKPGVVDPSMNDIINKADLYSGCYGRVSLVPSAYNVDGNKGIKFYLNNVQKLAEGEALSGVSNADDDFTAVENDFLN